MDVIEEKAECMFRHTSVLKSPYSKNLKTLHSTKLPWTLQLINSSY